MLMTPLKVIEGPWYLYTFIQQTNVIYTNILFNNIYKLLIIIIITRFRQCQGNYRISVAYRDNYPLE